MTNTTRKANRAARRIIKFTKTDWNPAQELEWAGFQRPMQKASAKRQAMCLEFVRAGHDAWRLRRALRAVEVRG